MAFDPNKFVVSTPKSIPVLLLLDVSSSMSMSAGNKEEGITKIQALNNAVNEMIKGFKEAQTLETFIKLGIITFGASVSLHTPLTPISDIENISPLSASGLTPLGNALKMAKDMIEDKNIFISSDYRPAVVLLSDGEPNDDWEMPLQDFIKDGRSSKCDRLAIAFGADADKDMLKKFIAGCENDLFYAEDAENLYKVFKRVTMSVSKRTKSANKNQTFKAPDDVTLDDDPTTY